MGLLLVFTGLLDATRGRGCVICGWPARPLTGVARDLDEEGTQVTGPPPREPVSPDPQGTGPAVSGTRFRRYEGERARAGPPGSDPDDQAPGRCA